MGGTVLYLCRESPIVQGTAFPVIGKSASLELDLGDGTLLWV